MLIQLSRNWWWLALGGIIAILFGIVALAWRADTLSSFMSLFGALALVDGIVAGLVTLINRSGKRRRWILLHGLISVAIAIVTFIWPDRMASILLYVVAVWALIMGILELVGAWELRRNISNDWLLLWSAFSSIIFAMLVVLLPKTAILSVAQMFAVIAVCFGLLLWVLSLNLRSMGKYAHAMRHS